MGVISDQYHSIVHLFHESKPSPTRAIFMDLTAQFLEAQHPVPAEGQDNQQSPHYRIYVSNKDMGVLGVHHLFVRLVNPENEVLCDIHGIRYLKDNKGLLQAFVEPKDFEYFSSLKSCGDTLVWEGSADATAHKMRRAMALVGLMNKAERPYHLLTQSCNTALHSLLEVMDIPMPKGIQGWTPGVQEHFADDIAKARESVDEDAEDNAAWFRHFLSALQVERDQIATRVPQPPAHVPVDRKPA